MDDSPTRSSARVAPDQAGRGPGRRRRWHRPVAIGLTIATTVGLLAGCAGKDLDKDGKSAKEKLNSLGDGKETALSDDGKTPKRGGKLVMSLSGETNGGYCLPEAQLASGIQVAMSIYDTLTVPDDKGGYAPYLAESVDHDASYSTWTIKVRKGIKFHDGSDLTPEVVKNNLDAYRGAYPTRKPLLFIFTFQNIADVKVEGDAVVVKVKSPGHEGARAARVRAAFAGRSDVAVSGSGDLVRIALAPVPATHVGPDKLAAAIRARLARLKLTPAGLSTVEKGSAQVSFATAEDADALRRDLRDGGEAFAVRVVDGEVDASGKPKAAGDLRLRSVEGETLWLRPEPLITGSMLEPGMAEFVTDELDQPRVTFRLTPEGARVLGGVTGAIVGQRLALMRSRTSPAPPRDGGQTPAASQAKPSANRPRPDRGR